MLRHLPDLEDRPQPFQDAVFLELFEVAELANLSRQEQTSYHNSLKYYRDLNNIVDTAVQEGEQKGRQEGRQEGRQQGRKEAAVEIARSLLNKLSVEAISQATGLTVAEVQALSDRP